MFNLPQIALNKYKVIGVVIIIAAIHLYFLSMLPQGDCTAPQPHTDLRHCSFAGLDAPNIDLRGSKLDYVDFTNAKFSIANLMALALKVQIYLGPI